MLQKWHDRISVYCWFGLGKLFSSDRLIKPVSWKCCVSPLYRQVVKSKCYERPFSVGWFYVFLLHSVCEIQILYSFKYNQQNSTLHNILYCCQWPTYFRRLLRQSSGAQNCTHNLWHMSSVLAATASVGEMELTPASGRSKQAWHIPDAVCTVLSSWWWSEKPPDTCRALTVIKNIV
jgi:hypothetical protein